MKHGMVAKEVSRMHHKKIGSYMGMHTDEMSINMIHISIFSNSFQTVQNLWMMKEMKVAQEGPMYTFNNFPSSGAICDCMRAQCV